MQKQKGVSTIVGIAIIVATAVILFGGVFTYQYVQTRLLPIVQTQQAQIQNNQTAGWKIYTSDKYGFEIKYPKNWEVSNSNVNAVSVWSSEKKKQEADNAIIPIYPEFSVNYEDLTLFKAFAKELLGRDVSGAKDFVSSNFYSFAETTVGGKKAYAGISVANRAVYTVYIESDNGVYVMSTEDLSDMGQDPKNPKIDENVKNIISTFKFTK